MLACKKSVKSRYMPLSPGLRFNQHSSREKRGPRATRKSSQLVYPRYVGVYTLRASCVPGKYVNILSMERNEEAVFLLRD